MADIDGNIRITYNLADLDEFIEDEEPDLTEIEASTAGRPEPEVISLMKTWRIPRDRLVGRASEALSEAHPTLRLDIPDAEIEIQDESVVITFLVT